MLVLYFFSGVFNKVKFICISILCNLVVHKVIFLVVVRMIKSTYIIECVIVYDDYDAMFFMISINF